MNVIFYHLTAENQQFIFEALRQSIADEADQLSVIHVVILNRKADELFTPNGGPIVNRVRTILGCSSLMENRLSLVFDGGMISAFADQTAATRLLMCYQVDKSLEISPLKYYASVCRFLSSMQLVSPTADYCFTCFDKPRYSVNDEVLVAFKIQGSLQYFPAVESDPHAKLLSERVQMHQYYHREISNENQAKQRLLLEASQPFLIYSSDAEKRKKLGAVDSFFYVCFLRTENDQLEKDMVRIPCYIDGNQLYRSSRLRGSEQPRLIEGTNIFNLDIVLEDLIQMFKDTPRAELRTYLCRPVGEAVLSNPSIVSMAGSSVSSSAPLRVHNLTSPLTSGLSLFTHSVFTPTSKDIRLDVLGKTQEDVAQTRVLAGVPPDDEYAGVQSTFI